MIKSFLKKVISVFSPKTIVKAEISVIAPSKLLDGKKAIITGGTGGIGYQMAKSFLDAGACVLITGRTQEKIDKTCKKLVEENEQWNGRIKGLAMDVSDVPHLSPGFDKAVEMLGGIDILVNNAGVEGGHINRCTEQQFTSLIDTNVKGMFFLSRIVASYMIENHVKGNILNICSSSSVRPANSVYAMTKWAARGLTEGLARMLIKHDIVVNGIAPGMTSTPMLNMNGSNDDLSLPRVLTGRFVTAEEVANMAVILVSNMSRMIVGDIIYMTGGSGNLYNEDVNYNFEYQL